VNRSAAYVTGFTYRIPKLRTMRTVQVYRWYMTSPETEAPIREVRDNLADVVDRAVGGSVTYVTRRGERVAAVVPLSVAAATRRPEPDRTRLSRPVPSAAGGRFPGLDPDQDDPAVPQAELTWTRAALESLHAELLATAGATLAAAGTVGQALAAVADRHFGTMADLLESLDQVAATGRLGPDADDLYDALTEPDDAQCTVCGAALNHFHGYTGWQHNRTVENDGRSVIEVFTPDDDHTPQVRWLPRNRPAIRDGRIAAN
jgi:prevent-host-death family protein